MSTEQIPVSVIVPAYNRRDTLLRALASVRNQRFLAPSEVIVVDDHSDDDTSEIAAAWGARVIRHTENRGAAAARNTAVAAAKQPWLAPLDSDDEWLPDHLCTLWPLRGGHVLVGGACVVSDESVAPSRTGYEGTLHRRPHVMRSPAALIPFNVVVNSGALVQRDVVQAAGGYNTGLRYAEDWDLWLRVLERGTGLITPAFVCRYHRHAGQKSGHDRGPRESHDQILLGCSQRSWWTKRIGDRWQGVRLWEGCKSALRAHELSEALELFGQMLKRPERMLWVVALRARFVRIQRRGRALSDGPLSDSEPDAVMGHVH